MYLIYLMNNYDIIFNLLTYLQINIYNSIKQTQSVTMKPSKFRNNQNDQTQRLVNEEAQEYESRVNKNTSHSNQHYSRIGHDWKQKQLRKKMKKQIYGEHYNYDYHKPNQKKMYRVQENRNTQIEKANRMLLQKIQNIFKRSHGRRPQINQTQPASDLQSFANPTRSQSHSIRQIRNRQKIQMDYDRPSNLHDYVVNQQVIKSNKKKKRHTEVADSMGSLNKGVEMAKMQILMQHQNQISKTGETSSFNKNMIKLSALQESMVSKRKRVQTQMYNQPIVGTIDERSAKNMTEHRNMKTSPAQQVNYLQNLYELQSNDAILKQNNHQISTHRFQNSKIQNQKQQQKIQNSNQKIILYKGNNVQISGRQYNIQVYVSNSLYTISATSQMEDGRQIQQMITVTYKDYQQLYRSILQHNHEKIVEHLKVENKNGLSLLQISEFERKYIDIFQHGQVTISENQKSKQNQAKHKNKNGNVIIHYSNQHEDSISSKEEPLNKNIKIEGVQDKTNANRKVENHSNKLQNLSSNLINLQIQPSNTSKKTKQDLPVQITQSKVKNSNSTKRSPTNPQNNQQFLSDIQPPNKPQIKSLQKQNKQFSQQSKPDKSNNSDNQYKNSKVADCQKDINKKNEIEEQVISDN